MPLKDTTRRKEYQKQYAAEHKDSIKALALARSRKPEIKAQRAAYRKIWAARPEVKGRLSRLRKNRAEADAPKRRASVKKWRKSNPAGAKLLKSRYWAKYKNRINEARRLARRLDPVKYSEIDKRSRSKPDVHERKLERDRLKYENNKEKHIAYVREYQRVNKDRLQPYRKLRIAIRRSREASASGSCSIVQWQQRYLFYGGHCAYCWTELSFVEAQMDHVKAIARGGSNWPSNIVPSCGPCNVSKNASKWIPEMYGFMTKLGAQPPKMATKDGGTRPIVTES